MTLGELITRLEAADPSIIVTKGFHHPYSYRGFYDELAFEPVDNITVGDMLAAARKALGTTYEGYKGGSYHMDDDTTVNIAEYGCCGEEIGSLLLSYMLKELS